MTRAEEIRSLQARYQQATQQRKPKTAMLIYARLRPLMTKQIKAELRQERKNHAA